MHAVSRQPAEHPQVANRPNTVSEASLHGNFRCCHWLRQQGRHAAVSSGYVKSKKIARLPLKMAPVVRQRDTDMEQRVRILCSLSNFLVAGVMGLLTEGIAHEEPITEQRYDGEELGVNRYTAPSIER